MEKEGVTTRTLWSGLTRTHVINGVGVVGWGVGGIEAESGDSRPARLHPTPT